LHEWHGNISSPECFSAGYVRRDFIVYFEWLSPVRKRAGYLELPMPME
jgi:hypothetical protein